MQSTVVIVFLTNPSYLTTRVTAGLKEQLDKSIRTDRLQKNRGNVAVNTYGVR